ncbi:MAG: hypothetical protein ACK4QL_07645 [Pseudanabaenaceae cyanobacterium]
MLFALMAGVAIASFSLWQMGQAGLPEWGLIFLLGLWLGRYLPLSARGQAIAGAWAGLGLLLYWLEKWQALVWVNLFWLGWAGVWLGAWAQRKFPLVKGMGTSHRALARRQLNSSMTWAVVWFMLSHAPLNDLDSWFLLVVALMAGAGLVGYAGWQLEHDPQTHYVSLQFYGWWGMDSLYRIPLNAYSRLESVQMQDVQELNWLTLAGDRQEITLPMGLELSPEMQEQLRRELHLAKHHSDRDGLGLVGILLPQGASILAGLVVGLWGLVCWWALPSDLPTLPSWLGVWLLLAIAAMSPATARAILLMVAPAHLRPEPSPRTYLLHSWEWGLALGSGLIVVSTPNHLEPLLGIGLVWFCLIVSCCLLALVRRTPLLWKWETD